MQIRQPTRVGGRKIQVQFKSYDYYFHSKCLEFFFLPAYFGCSIRKSIGKPLLFLSFFLSSFRLLNNALAFFAWILPFGFHSLCVDQLVCSSSGNRGRRGSLFRRVHCTGVDHLIQKVPSSILVEMAKWGPPVWEGKAADSNLIRDAWLGRNIREGDTVCHRDEAAAAAKRKRSRKRMCGFSVERLEREITFCVCDKGQNVNIERPNAVAGPPSGSSIHV